ncbi:phage tail spike protein [Peribacillus sp. TH24]|uniref:phage baseplate protein n=1 Tax=Peribacillus sp. TH24 TaxID=2798483 RepID=UPI0019141721|nr:phage tail spike protein [Peribacillus sp. TH24]MBK5446071.1 phage tail protein [Peribacillus sp. TH24]
MIYILNSDDKIIGYLDNNNAGACPFYNDVHSSKIADESGKIWAETLTLDVPYGYEETDLLDTGTQLLIADSNERFKLFTIYDKSDVINGLGHLKKVDAINSLAWKLNHTYVEEKSWTAASSKDVISYIFQRSGWTLDEFNDFFSGGTKSYTVSEGKAQAALDNATKDFSIELEAYAVISKGNIIEKRAFFTERLGEVTGERFEYRHNLKGATRTKSNLEFYTKLYVFGGQNAKGERATITSVNKVKVPGSNNYEYLPFILDEEANDKYNTGNAYLEGFIVKEDIIRPEGLLTWGREQMKTYNHPKYTYTLDVALLDTLPGLGDTIAVIDHEMNPPLTITARVLETNYSQADSSADNVVFGEFVTINTVTPNEIWKLQALASQALQAIQEKTSWKIEMFTPDGLDFSSSAEKKRLIVRVFEGLDNITAQIPKEGFLWEMLDNEGAHVEKWEEAHIGVGNVIEVGREVAAYTIRCSVNDETTKPVIFAEEKDFAFFCRLQNEPKPGDTDFNSSVAQYAAVDATNNHIYWTQGYRGSLVTAADIAAGESFSITRTDLSGTILDRMVCKHGGHGSHFGLKIESGKVYIYSPFKDVAQNKVYLVKFPYTAGKLLKWGDSSIKSIYAINTRFNLDDKNGYYLLTSGVREKATFKIARKADMDAGIYKILYSLTATDFGVSANQVYQSATLDFPYLYVTYGGSNGNISNGDAPTLYCVDVRSRSLVYKINYTFTEGTITPEDEHHEAETVNYYYDKDGTKWILQGFAFSHEVEEWKRRNNVLYRAKETIRTE